MKRRRRETGQAMVEYALTSVLFFTMIFFIIDGGLILWNYEAVAEAARVGARYGITHGSQSTAPVGPGDYAALRQAVLDKAIGLDPANLTITASWNPNNHPGNTITVNVTYTTQPVTSLFWPGQVLTLQGQSSMVIQN